MQSLRARVTALETEAAEAAAAKATFEEQLAKMRKAASFWKEKHDQLKGAGASASGGTPGSATKKG
jgi:hypothetical protein